MSERRPLARRTKVLVVVGVVIASGLVVVVAGLVLRERSARQRFEREAERLSKCDPPQWKEAIAALDAALDHALPYERETLRRRIERFEREERDERAFEKAVKCIRFGHGRMSDDAIALLASIGTDSRTYLDAQTYIHWIHADRDVRAAKIAYDAGQWEKSKTLLESAHHIVADLGPDTGAGLSRRSDRWSSVEQSFREGMELSARGDAANAIVKLEHVLSLEPDEDNHYHVLATNELQAIRGRAVSPATESWR